MRASIPLHKGHEAACLDLADTPPDDLRELLEVARKTQGRAPKDDPGWKRLADDVVATLLAEISRRRRGNAVGRVAEAARMLAEGVDQGDVAAFMGAKESMITREIAEAMAARHGAGCVAIHSSDDGWYVSSPESRARDPQDAALYERHVARAGGEQ